MFGRCSGHWFHVSAGRMVGEAAGWSGCGARDGGAHDVCKERDRSPLFVDL